MEKENKLGTMPISKLIINMSLPIIASMLVQALYNIVDSVFVSRVCEQALTAVSLAFPAQNLMIGLATGTAVGVNALMGRALGAKDQQRANAVAINGVFLAVVGFVISAVLALLFAARGLFLGYCAASVAAQSGASALLRYRLDTLLSDVGTLLLCLWLAGWAVRLAMELFRAVRGRAVRETPGTARRLAVRFAAALALSAAFAAVGAVFTVMGIGGVGR